MAARSLLFHLRRKSITTNSRTKIELKSLAFSSTSDALRNETLEHEDSSPQFPDDLKSRIFRLRLPKRSATNIIQKWVNEGNSVTLPELRHISKELRKSHRYKHALEITEWMVSDSELELSDSDYAVRLDLMTKVFGIDATERYFEGLPHDVKTSETYTALLHSYASAKLIDKAEELFQRMKDSGLSFCAITYNELMTLYMSMGQVEKVSLVIEELKNQKVAPDLFTYNLWVSSCAATLNIEGVRNILSEMSQDPNSDDGWVRYRNLANIYVTTGQLTSSGASSLVEAEKSLTQREWISYDFLIILHTSLGNKDMVDQIWKSLRMTKQKMIGRNYVPILSSYLILEHMKEVGEVIDQWKNSTTSIFDNSVCDRLADAFVEAGFTERAEAFRSLLIEKDDAVDESK
ncbi:pentatricopeptide repeat-containing protein At5g09450, mitochondrial [Beta vulgaris subsp. vulgaris]|uniref:pentatricopeptide repeat-containing protein At5g09450, mitochondrial n=1 Tax=Beta vulgaris subsp. vulgaris TaxID=3555 RepID=UPI0020368682|nr:pentatricopeptide repeat-containing protein At5g09450, mitochondrial [Beta vulgaris subsp. vulgaris]